MVVVLPLPLLPSSPKRFAAFDGEAQVIDDGGGAKLHGKVFDRDNVRHKPSILALV